MTGKKVMRHRAWHYAFGQSSLQLPDEGSRCHPPRRTGRLVSCRNARQPSAIQASGQARAGDHRRQAFGRPCARNIKQYLEAVRAKGAALMRYAIVIEKADGNYSAYVPDLPGCVATGDTVAAVEGEIRDAIRFHIEGLKEDGLPVPEPTSIAEYV